MFVDAPFCFYLLIDLLGRLVTFGFLENKAKEGSNNKLDKVTTTLTCTYHQPVMSCGFHELIGLCNTKFQSYCIIIVIVNEVPITSNVQLC